MFSEDGLQVMRNHNNNPWNIILSYPIQSIIFIPLLFPRSFINIYLFLVGKNTIVKLLRSVCGRRMIIPNRSVQLPQIISTSYKVATICTLEKVNRNTVLTYYVWDVRSISRSIGMKARNCEQEKRRRTKEQIIYLYGELFDSIQSSLVICCCPLRVTIVIGSGSYCDYWYLYLPIIYVCFSLVVSIT